MARRRPRGLLVHVMLPENLLEMLEEAAWDELEIAQLKWQYCLNEREQQEVIDTAFSQLPSKISDLGGKHWDFGDNMITMVVSGPTDEIELRDDTCCPKQYGDRFILRKTTRFELFADDNDGSVSQDLLIPVSNFRQFMIDSLKEWTRTAIFYGVGSYA